jgi:hypothetical protein
LGYVPCQHIFAADLSGRLPVVLRRAYRTGTLA